MNGFLSNNPTMIGPTIRRFGINFPAKAVRYAILLWSGKNCGLNEIDCARYMNLYCRAAQEAIDRQEYGDLVYGTHIIFSSLGAYAKFDELSPHANGFLLSLSNLLNSSIVTTDELYMIKWFWELMLRHLSPSIVLSRLRGLSTVRTVLRLLDLSFSLEFYCPLTNGLPTVMTIYDIENTLKLLSHEVEICMHILICERSPISADLLWERIQNRMAKFSVLFDQYAPKWTIDRNARDLVSPPLSGLPSTLRELDLEEVELLHRKIGSLHHYHIFLCQQSFQPGSVSNLTVAEGVEAARFICRLNRYILDVLRIEWWPRMCLKGYLIAGLILREPNYPVGNTHFKSYLILRELLDKSRSRETVAHRYAISP
jgi:hypothetical protein